MSTTNVSLANPQLFVALALTYFISAGASAGPFTLYLSGAMERPTANAAAAGLTEGDRFALALSLDPDAVTNSFSSPFSSQPDTMTYFGGIVGLTGTLAGIDLALGAPLNPDRFGPAEIGYRRGDTYLPDRHSVQFGPSLDTAFGDAQLTRLFIGFLDYDGTFLSSTAFNADPFVPDFLSSLEQATVQFQFTLTSGAVENPLGLPDYAGLTPQASVPSPTTGVLLLTAILGQGMAWRLTHRRHRTPRETR